MKLPTEKCPNNNAVYNTLRDVYDQPPVARQSFEEARDQISHTAFEELFRDSAQTMTDEPDTILYKGYRVLAIDGSTSALPNTDALKAVFGKSTPVDGETYCRISICADVLNEFILDGEIAGFDTGERVLAAKHLDRITIENALFLFDRGYWNPELITNICNSGRKFVIRLASNGISAVTKSKNPDGCFVLKGTDITLRFHNFVLPGGETEYLVTNLDCDEVSNSELEALYFLRWGVETRYNELKNQVGLMRFPGKSELVVLQDFYAQLTVMNFIAAAVYDADKIVQSRRQGKNLKHRYKPNKSTAIEILSTNYLKAAIEPDPVIKESLFLRLSEDIAWFTVAIRPDRHFQRRVDKSKKKRTHKS